MLLWISTYFLPQSDRHIDRCRLWMQPFLEKVSFQTGSEYSLPCITLAPLFKKFFFLLMLWRSGTEKKQPSFKTRVKCQVRGHLWFETWTVHLHSTLHIVRTPHPHPQTKTFNWGKGQKTDENNRKTDQRCTYDACTVNTSYIRINWEDSTAL